MNVFERLFRTIQACGDRTALVDVHGRIRFSVMGEAIELMLEWLHDQGCEKGDRIASLTLNCNETFILEWAIYKLGAIWISIPSLMRDYGVVENILLATQPKLLFIDPDALPARHAHFLQEWPLPLPRSKSSQFMAPPDIPGLYFDRFTIFRNPALRREPFFKTRDDLIRIRYTSGSGGNAKGIIYSTTTLAAYVENIGRIVGEDPETMVHALPIVWASGSLTLPVLLRGGKVVTIPKWNLKEYVEAIAFEKGTLTFLVPRILRALVRYSENFGSGWAGSLKRMLVAGAPVSVRTMRKALNLFPWIEIYVTLGMTEASFPITWHRAGVLDVRQKDRSLIPLGSLTPAYQNSKIQETSGRGELWVDGDSVAPGKLQKVGGRCTMEPLPRPYPSGDLMEMENGVLHSLGRANLPWDPLSVGMAPTAIEALFEEGAIESGC